MRKIYKKVSNFEREPLEINFGDGSIFVNSEKYTCKNCGVVHVVPYASGLGLRSSCNCIEKHEFEASKRFENALRDYYSCNFFLRLFRKKPRRTLTFV